METPADSLEPMGNWTWRAMSAADRAVLTPHARLKRLKRGDLLAQKNDVLDTVHFPVTADVANVVRQLDGLAAMATTVGRDGMTGLAAFLAEEPIGWDLLVQISGDAWSLPADVLRRQSRASAHLQVLLMRLTHKNQVEAAINVVCSQRHPITERLARWLLTTQDRTGLSEVRMTQEEVGALLGVQRTTLNEAVQHLASVGGVSVSRGVVRIRNRAVVRRCACECYDTVGLSCAS